MRIKCCISHHFKGVWRITLSTLCFFRYYFWMEEILKLILMCMLRIIVIIALLFHLLLLLLILLHFFFLIFVLHVVDFMMLVDLDFHQLLLNIFVFIHVQGLYTIKHLLLFLQVKSVLEL